MNANAEPFPKIPLGEMFDLGYGASLPERERSGIGYPVFGSNGIVGRHAKFLVPGPGIVVGRKGSVGEVCWSEEPFWPIDTAYYVIAKEGTDLRWLFWLLTSTDLKSLDAATGVPGLNRNDVYALRVHRARPDEQSRIAAVLDTVDGAIAKTEAVIAKLKQVRTGLLHDLLTRGLDENGLLRNPVAHPEQFRESPLGRIPKEWRVSTVEQLDLQIIDGDRGSNYPNESQLLEQGFCVFLNNKNIVDGGFDFSETQFISEERDSLLGKGKLNLGDIVITTRGTVGNIAWFSDLHPYRHIRINSGMIILRAYEAIFVPQFLVAVWGFLFSSEYRRLSSGSAQPQFPIRDMQQFGLLVPKKCEQERIVGASTAVDGEIACEGRALTKLRHLKSGLMTDLLTGRVRVPENIMDGGGHR